MPELDRFPAAHELCRRASSDKVLFLTAGPGVCFRGVRKACRSLGAEIAHGLRPGLRHPYCHGGNGFRLPVDCVIRVYFDPAAYFPSRPAAETETIERVKPSGKIGENCEFTAILDAEGSI